MDSREETLLARASELCQDPAFRSVVWRHCGNSVAIGDIRRLSTSIHRNDQMLLHSLNHFLEVNWSLSQYFNVALQQHRAAQQILRSIFGTPGADFYILDFACGYGRLLRFLSLWVPPAQICSSEIQGEALDFVMGEFGVHGVLSKADPRDLAPPRQFDFVWVASLFSHLPRHLFHGWLERLLSTLGPGGVLCFSVRDESLLPEDMEMPHDGFRYMSISENADLETSVYGTTWVSEAFVRSAIEECCGSGHPCFRIRKGLANEQDIYVVAKDRERDLARLASFRKGAWGWVDECRVSEAGELYLRGWAASLDDGPIDFVEITLDGQLHRCPTGLESDDVRRVLKDDRLGWSAWEWRYTLAPSPAAPFIEVTARSAAGEMALLYAGRIERPVASD